MTVHLTPAQEQRLERIAAQAGLNPEDLLRGHLDRYLSEEEELLLAAKHGREDIAAGRYLEHQDVITRIDTLLAGR